MPRLFRLLPLSLVLAAAGAPAALAAADLWSCSDGRSYTAVYDNDQLVLSGKGVTYTLLPRRAASGSLYAGGGIRFHEKGDNAVMIFPGGGQVTCTRGGASKSPPSGPDGALTVAGQSYGGVVRSGPSRSSARIGSLREGEPVTILADTGVVWNNYRWFRIRFRGNRTGFQWGGILCARRTLVPGIYKVCE